MAVWEAKGKSFIVTGGASGMGARYVGTFLDQGAKQGLVSLILKGIAHIDKSERGAGGTIVNISSAAALLRLPSVPVYSAAKSAVIHFCRCIALDPFYFTTGVRILCMCFGGTDTPILHNLESRAYNPKLGKELAKATPENGVYYQKLVHSIVDRNGRLTSGEFAVKCKPILQ